MFKRLALVLLPFAALAAAQTPTVYVGGVVSAASLYPAGAPNYGAAPGSIVSIFGTNLTTGTTQSAASIPLATTLGGSSVTIGGSAAPLFFVSPGQINAQVPYGITAGSQPVIVKTSGGTSTSVTVPIANTQPALFSVTQNGTGQAAAQNAVVSGSNVTYVNNGASLAIVQGNTLVAYGSGGGALASGNVSGAACTGQQFPTGTATATIGGVNAAVQYAGCSPGFVGLDQWNITIPSTLPDGCFLPLQVTVGGAASNVVTVSVSKTGNCNSATTGVTNFGVGAGNYGAMFIERIAVPFAGLLVTEGAFAASFNQSVASTNASAGGFPPAGAGCLTEITKGAGSGNPVGFPAYSNQNHLDAGASLTLTSPSGTAFQATQTSPGSYSIAASLTGALTVAPGKWTATGTGGKDIGAFSGVLNISQLFTVTNVGVSGTTFSQSSPLTSTWTCPDPSGSVIVSVNSTNTNTGVSGGASCSAVCSAGTFTMPSSILKQLPVSTSGGAQVTVLFLPSITSTPTFTAPGLTQPGIFVYIDLTAAPSLTLNP